MLNDYTHQAVIVTGATRGIGLATALRFAQAGAQCYITHKWGGTDEGDVRRRFEEVGAPRPVVVQADAASEEDTERLLDEVHRRHDSVAAFVSNVSVAQLVKSFDDYGKRALFQTLEYSCWPLFHITSRIRVRFGRYPRYVIGMSSAGADSYVHNYDFMAASKSAMEILSQYLNYRLYDEDIRINVVRAGMVPSDSLTATFGEDFERMAAAANMKRLFVTPESIAETIFALASGWMDAVSGQVIRADKGQHFFDTFMRIYSERDCTEFTQETQNEQK